MRRGPLIYLAAVAAMLVLFWTAPGIDLWASGLFYRPGQGFFLAQDEATRFIYRAVPWLVVLMVIGLPLTVFAGWRRGRPIAGIDLRAGIFLIAVLAIGPGLLVNTLLKDHWGRARPSQVTEFGGTQRFTPAAIPADQCDRNCSFPAGHPAVGFSLVAFAFLAASRRRKIIEAVAIGFGAAVGIVRIAQGGHFLSDVIFSGLIVYGVAWLLHLVVIERDAFTVLGKRLAMRFGPAAPRWAGYAGLTIAATLAAIVFLDRPAAIYFHGAAPPMIEVFRIVTRFGISTWYLIGAALLFFLLRGAASLVGSSDLAERFNAFAWVPLFIFLSIAVSGLLTDILKAVFGRARPKLLFSTDNFGFDWWDMKADFWSFPSGHTTTIVALATALYILWPRYRMIYIGAAVLVAASRIVIGAHYVSDVIFATFVALATTAYIRQIFARSGIDLDRAKRGEPSPHSELPWRARFSLRPPPTDRISTP